MGIRELAGILFKLIFYVGSYLLVINFFSFFGYASCFSYVGAILLLPIFINPVRSIFYAVLIGFIVDIYHNSPGIHTSACVLLAFLRANFLKWTVPSGGYEEYMVVSIPSMGLKWYFLFAFPLIFFHHLDYYLIEYSNLSLIGLILLKSFLSTIFTFVVIILLQYTVEGSGKKF